MNDCLLFVVGLFLWWTWYLLYPDWSILWLIPGRLCQCLSLVNLECPTVVLTYIRQVCHSNLIGPIPRSVEVSPFQNSNGSMCIWALCQGNALVIISVGF